MKIMKNEVELDDDDADDSHVLLGFDDSTNYYNNKSTSENYATTETPPNQAQYFRWTPESIKMMLTMRFDMDRDFAQRLRQKKDLWNEIAAEMGRLGGYVITGEVCDLKFRNMLQTYKKNRTKEERGLQELIIWEYYGFFKQATLRSIDTSGEPLIPSMLCESVCIEDTESATTKHSEKAVPDLSAEEETTTIPKRQSTRRKRPRSISTQVYFENSLGEQEHMLIEAKKRLVQSEKTSCFTQQTSSEDDAEHPKQEHQTSTSTFAKVESQISWSMQPPPQLQPQPPPPQLQPQPPPPQITNWLTPTEQSECEVFGQSVGLQLANLRDPYTRSLLKLKIQELIFLAGTGKLPAFSSN